MKRSLVSRILAAGMALAMGVSLTACGGSSTGADTAADDSGAETTGDTASEGGSESSGTGEAQATDEEPYEVVLEWLSIGNTPSEENLVKIEEAINEITLPAINCTVNLYPVELSELASANTLALSTGEKIDLICSVGTGVGELVTSGLVVPMDEYLGSYGADLQACLGDALKGGYYDNQLYGVPNAYIQSEKYGYIARKDILDKYGITIDENKLYTLEELGDIFATVSAGEGAGFYCVSGQTSVSDTYTEVVGTIDKLGATTSAGVLMLEDNWSNTTIENLYASDSYKKYAEIMYDWAQKGYIPSDAASNTDTNLIQMSTGNYLGSFYWTTPGGPEGFSTSVGYEMVPISLVDPYKTTDRYQNILWSIPTTSERPDKAFQFLNFLYGDNDVDSILMFGLEGETYQVIEENESGDKLVEFVEGIDATTAPYYCYAGIYGDRLSWPIWAPNDIGLNETLREFNETVKNISPAMGYCVTITDEMSSKYAAVQSVVSQYTPVISAGAVDPEESLANFNKALEDAGINDVIAANQAQLDAWLAEQ